jgi:hypothetical protein
MEMAGPLAELINDLGINPNLKVSTYEAADVDRACWWRNGLALEEVFGGAAEQTVLLANSDGRGLWRRRRISPRTRWRSVRDRRGRTWRRRWTGSPGWWRRRSSSIYDYQLALAQGGGGGGGGRGVVRGLQHGGGGGGEQRSPAGSDAGTSLKAMIQRLVPQSKEAAGAMADLGLEFFNADGSMRDMAEIAGELNRAFAGLTEEQRISYMSTIFRHGCDAGGGGDGELYGRGVRSAAGADW